MTRAELLQETRFVIGDDVEPFKVSDTILLRWLSDAQDKFCERTGFFEDSSAHSITTVDGTRSYAISERIVEVHKVFRADGTEIVKKSLLGGTTLATATGEPSYWFTDLETGKMSFHPVPDAEYVYTLKTHTMSEVPLNNKTDGVYDQDPSIPARFQQSLIEWAAFMLYSVHDQELQDKKKASDHYAAWRLALSEGRSAYTTLMGTQVSFEPNRGYVV